MKKTLIFLAGILFLLTSCNQKFPEPVNPDTSPEARDLLEMFYETQGTRTLSGQHNYARRQSLHRSTDTVIARTGETPVIWGSDFGIPQMRNRMLEAAEKEYRKGHIITLMWHAPCPIDTIPEKVNPVRYMPNEEEWKDIVTQGTKFNDALIADIDAVAEGLKSLRDKQVPVIWRPYHEMNGIWFWWGNQPGEEGFIKLWKIMYDRFTEHHGLNNLIWTWNANAPRDWEDDQAYAYELFYPGADYVDVLAADVYKRDFKQSHHDDLLALAGGKLIALGEIGLPPTPEELDEQPMWSWFMMWANWPIKYVEPEDLNALYHHDRVVNFEAFKANR